VRLGYSDGLLPTRAVITQFLRLILSLWREHSQHRAEVSRRGLFVRACTRLRLLSKLFYQWVSRTSLTSYRSRVWARAAPLVTLK
jgi:hypothetical protein